VDLSSIATQALHIRAVEDELLSLFRKGEIAGTIHTCLGQELCAAALAPYLDITRDAFFATHRCHGHYLALGGSLEALIAELTGREGALCHGHGGSQHLCFDRFFSNGVQGATAPLAVGYSWALKRQAPGAMAVAQLGDGSLGQGVLYEAMNFAALLELPLLFLVEDNGIAMSTERANAFRGDLAQRATGFGLDHCWLSDRDPEALVQRVGDVVNQVRDGRPTVLVLETRRLGPHSKGDDTRPLDQVKRLWTQDPVHRMVQSDEALLGEVEAAARQVQAVTAQVLARPLLAPSSLGALPPERRASGRDNSESLHADEGAPGSSPFCVETLNAALTQLMADDFRVLVVGEDVADPYGGAFKVTRSLSSTFGDRLFASPISESAIVGTCNGLALAGLRPIAEIMFADFATLSCDQLINHAAKFYYSYGGQVRCPVTVRLVSGGGRGYGPTHSQSLERLFCGVPGLRVLALSHRHRPDVLLKRIMADDGPTVLVEHKTVYRTRVPQAPPLDLVPVRPGSPLQQFPPLRYVPQSGGSAQVTLVTYGGSALVLERAMEQLIVDEELQFDYFIYTQLWPLDVTSLVASVKETGKLFVLEEGPAAYGFATALVSACQHQTDRHFQVATCGAQPVPLPAALHLEQQVLPSSEAIVGAISSLCNGSSVG
jgi:2-oxoisovalerate dehydrogenase E1 component